jgi:hypothetical protein
VQYQLFDFQEDPVRSNILISLIFAVHKPVVLASYHVQSVIPILGELTRLGLAVMNGLSVDAAHEHVFALNQSVSNWDLNKTFPIEFRLYAVGAAIDPRIGNIVAS